MKKNEEGKVLRRRERGIAVSIYFPNSMRPTLDRLYDLIDDGELNSVSQFVCDAVKEKWETKYNERI
tara:strand:+ start:1070 stop:1270 length:201 start_codon:yes stop_codon:yes gene_type:complete